MQPAAVRLAFLAKGAEGICGITDAVYCAGLPDGDYGHVVMKNGEVYLRDGSSLAGSSLTMLRALRNAVQFTGLPLEQVYLSYTLVPARQAKVLDRKGTLEIGKDADFIVIDDQFQLQGTIVRGKAVVNRGMDIGWKQR